MRKLKIISAFCLAITLTSVLAADCAKVKNECIERCSNSSLPSGDHGFKFWNCVNRCMKDNGCEP